MSHADKLTQMARQLLAEVTPKEGSAEALAAGLQAASRRLDAALSPILGSLGVRMLLLRAAERSALRYPFLNAVNVYEDGIDASSVVAQRIGGSDEQISAAFQDLMVCFVDLLADQVGRDLAIILVQRAIGREC